MSRHWQSKQNDPVPQTAFFVTTFSWRTGAKNGHLSLGVNVKTKNLIYALEIT